MRRLTRASWLAFAQVDVVKGIFWNFIVYEKFDRRPPIVAPRNDFGVTTGFGWTF